MRTRRDRIFVFCSRAFFSLPAGSDRDVNLVASRDPVRACLHETWVAAGSAGLHYLMQRANIAAKMLPRICCPSTVDCTASQVQSSCTRYIYIFAFVGLKLLFDLCLLQLLVSVILQFLHNCLSYMYWWSIHCQGVATSCRPRYSFQV